MILYLLLALVTLVTGTHHTYTDGTDTWAGNPYCKASGVLPQPGSPVIDAGAITPDHCPARGPCDDPNLIEWYGAAPDIGACEYVPKVAGPKGLQVK